MNAEELANEIWSDAVDAFNEQIDRRVKELCPTANDALKEKVRGLCWSGCGL